MHVTPQNAYVGQLVADELARRGGFKLDPDAWKAFAVQAQRETGGVITANNPLNLTDPGGAFLWRDFGQVGHRSGGSAQEWHTDFAAFDTVEGGARAAAANYLGGLYGGVVGALRRGAGPVELAAEIERSPWDSGRYSGTLDEEVAAHVGMVASPPSAAAVTPVALVPDPAAVIGDIGGAIAAAPAKVVGEVTGRVAGAVFDHFSQQLVVGLLALLAVVVIVGVLA